MFLRTSVRKHLSRRRATNVPTSVKPYHVGEQQMFLRVFSTYHVGGQQMFLRELISVGEQMFLRVFRTVSRRRATNVPMSV